MIQGVNDDPVVVTGIGLICGLGQDTDTVWRRMLNGDAVAAPIPDHWWQYADYDSRYWAPLPELDLESLGMIRLDRLRLDPVSMLSLGAARAALCNAGLSPDANIDGPRIPGFDPARIGVFAGTGIGGIDTTLRTHLYHATSRLRGELAGHVDVGIGEPLSRLTLDRRFNPLAVTMLMPNAVAAVPGVRLGVRGPCRTLTQACSSGTAAIGAALAAIRSGEVDIALAGAAEYLFDDYGSIFRCYDITGAMTTGFDEPSEANRPFDERRTGFLFSQGGAAMLVLERASTAHHRGVEPLAELVAYAESFDGHNLIAMRADGSGIRAMLDAMLTATRIRPQAIDYINAHGTGTPMNDRIELEVLAEIFGERPLINSTKGLIGHTIGASGAIEAAVTALSIRDQRVHPCHNLEHPSVPVNLPRVAVAAPIEWALSQSFAFGGHNGCLLMRRPGSD